MHEACDGDLSMQGAVERLIEKTRAQKDFLAFRWTWLPAISPSLSPKDSASAVIASLPFSGRQDGRSVEGAGRVRPRCRVGSVNSGLAVNQLRRGREWLRHLLNHPGIVTVYDVIVWEGTPVLVLELVTRTSLSPVRRPDVGESTAIDSSANLKRTGRCPYRRNHSRRPETR